MTGQPHPPVLETRLRGREREEAVDLELSSSLGVPSGHLQAASRVISGTMTTFWKSSEARDLGQGLHSQRKACGILASDFTGRCVGL